MNNDVNFCEIKYGDTTLHIFIVQMTYCKNVNKVPNSQFTLLVFTK